MNILIIGGSGFIGTRLVTDLLKNENNKIKIFDKVVADTNESITIQGDVRNIDQLVDVCKGIDVIYNLAAEHADNVTPLSLYSDVNIDGAKNIVEAAKINGIKSIVFTSSVAIYGLNRGTPNEEMEAKPFNEYGRTKYEAEKIFLDWADSHKDNSLTILRPAVVFGENNRGNVYNLLKQVAGRKFLMVGSGKNYKSMAYVGNISAFLSSKSSSKKGIEIFNFADKPDLNSAEIVQIVKDEMNITIDFFAIPYFMGLLAGYTFDLLAFVTGKKFPVSSVRIKKFCAETTVNTNRLSKSGFIAPFSAEEGLRKMISHEFK
ncbi:NAD-dependent epimerase/dehydratase family protein [Maribacter arcticus]|uniref:NAD-dependent epimerase/dehydratase family protein n=1 Tax=Maribacter arcticus TaxID=561365 RepID=UPI003001FC36